MAQATAKAVISGLPMPTTGAKKGETNQNISISLQTNAGKEPEERDKLLKETAASITRSMRLNDGGLAVSGGKDEAGFGEAQEALISAHDQLEKNNKEMTYQMKSFTFLKD